MATSTLAKKRMTIIDKFDQPYKVGDIVVYSALYCGQSAVTQIHVVRKIDEQKGNVSTHKLGRLRDKLPPGALFGPYYVVGDRKSCIQTPSRGVILPHGYIQFVDETHPDMSPYSH